MNTKIIILLITLILTTATTLAQRVNPEVRKNSVVKQWIQSAKGTAAPFLDNVATYDSKGRKIEETEYASYGQKERLVYEYEGDSDRCTRIIEYDDKNRVVRIKKIEYNENGTRKAVFTYSPKGQLKATKTYEYSTK